MSLRSMIGKERTRVDIKYEDATVGTGGQLTKTWKMRYKGVPARIVAQRGQTEAIEFDRQTVFADYDMYIEYRSGILLTDRVVFEARTFQVVKVDNWDEAKRYLRISLVEVKV